MRFRAVHGFRVVRAKRSPVRANQTEEIRRALTDPKRLAERLGLSKGGKLQSGGGVLVRCPAHAENTPSCSVTRGPDGTVRVKCFGCDFAGDALTLIARVHGLDPKREFKTVLLAAAELMGLHEVAAELRGEVAVVPRALPPAPEPEPDRDYPPEHEVRAVWEAALPVDQIEPCQVALALRGLFPDASLARALTGIGALPRWARYQGRSWADTGHRIILRAFDCTGTARSLRAWQVNRDSDGPKRLPAAGHRASELVLANGLAAQHLADPKAPIRLLVVEGEPDFLALCQGYPGANVIGVMSGSWSSAFAERVPFGSLVSVRTHRDEAGEKYAAAIIKTLAGRAVCKRMVA